MRRLVLLSLTLSFVPILGRAEAVDAPRLWNEANAAFEAQKYADAAAGYEKLIDSGIGTADVYFNLGTAELRAGRRGAAILAFERTLRLEPSDADAAFNLEEAQKGNVDKIVGAREEEPLLERLGARVPAGTAATVFIGTWLLCWAALLGRLFSTRARGLLAGLALTAGLIALVSGAGLGLATWVRSHSAYAVVVSPEAPIREGPAKTFKAAFDVHEGLKVRVVQHEQGFLRVRLPNGIEGWVDEKDAPVI